MSKEVYHIWVGRFGPGAPEDYFVQAQDDGSGTPLCQFAADQGAWSFDYDFVEISWALELKDVRTFVDGHSYSRQYLDKVVSLAAARGLEEANVFVLAPKDEFPKPRSVSGDGYTLCYLGEFECDD
jgi:hypothetical protein